MFHQVAGVDKPFLTKLASLGPTLVCLLVPSELLGRSINQAAVVYGADEIPHDLRFLAGRGMSARSMFTESSRVLIHFTANLTLEVLALKMGQQVTP